MWKTNWSFLSNFLSLSIATQPRPFQPSSIHLEWFVFESQKKKEKKKKLPTLWEFCWWVYWAIYIISKKEKEERKKFMEFGFIYPELPKSPSHPHTVLYKTPHCKLFDSWYKLYQTILLKEKQNLKKMGKISHNTHLTKFGFQNLNKFSIIRKGNVKKKKPATPAWVIAHFTQSTCWVLTYFKG